MNIRNILRPIYGPPLAAFRQYKKQRFIKHDVERVKSEIRATPSTCPRVFYLGITAHSNLGDMAQYYCIHNWILNNYPHHALIEIEADTVVSIEHGCLDFIRQVYRKNDIIVFQSGYTTQDLGGVHDLMHRMVIEAIPEAKILMMPQTVFFQHEENRQLSAAIYNKAGNMLFLARDRVSFEMAKQMMPDVRVELYPDIVTSLIGTLDFSGERHGVCLCRRNDGEKFYSDEELSQLTGQIEKTEPVTVCDTTINVPFKKLRENRQFYIERQIEYFSKFKVVVTDRYHGTIFALAAGTPVVIIKTNDHKVVTGADWFKGIYDDYVSVADGLDDALKIVERIVRSRYENKLQPVFSDRYYSRLRDLFEE